MPGKFRKIKVPTPVKERALALAARKLRSAAELQVRLAGEGYTEDEIATAIARLREIHLIDDNLVAHSISRRYADRGNRFIAQKMKSKGLAADEHESAFEELPDEFERALAAGEKKLRTLRGLDPRTAGQKLYQHLALRGFQSATAQKVARRLTDSEEAD